MAPAPTLDGFTIDCKKIEEDAKGPDDCCYDILRMKTFPPGTRMLIVFYNTLWDQPLTIPEGIPAGCTISTDATRLDDADVVVFHIPSLPASLFASGRLRRPPKQRWVAWSKECEVHYPQLADANFMAAFNTTMTYRLDSDVPVSYVPPDFSRSILHPPKGIPIAPHQRRTTLANAFISSPYDRNGRGTLLRDLADCLDIDSYGRLMRTIEPTETTDTGVTFKLSTIANYKFTLAFENASAVDYVTEKFYQPLLVGSVPVVLGAPNIEAFAPGDHCYINAADFDSAASLAEHLKTVANDDALYQRYHAWRHQPLRSAFMALEQQQQRPALSRLCARLLATTA